MAMTPLDPQTLAAIQAYYSTPQYQNSGEGSTSMAAPGPFTYNGNTYLQSGGNLVSYADNPSWDQNGQGANYNGQQYTTYDAQGNPLGTGSLSVKDDWSTNPMTPFLLAGAGMGAGMLAGAGAGMGAGAADLGALGTGGLPSYASLAAGDQAAIDAAMGSAGAGATGAGAAGAAAGGGAGGLPTLAPLDTSTLPEAISAGSIPAPMATTGGGFASYLTSLGVSPATASTISGLLGPAAAVLGAAVGSQPVKSTQTGQSRMDPRMDSFVYGANGQPGLLNYAQGLLAQGMSPQGQAGWQSIMSKGMGLMNQPVAQNGFNLFTGNRYGAQ